MEKKYVKHLTLEELAERMAAELVKMHNDTAIHLGYWETALELVERFYHLDVSVHVVNKRESK